MSVSSDLILLLLFATLGLVLGSFGNVLICRLPSRQTILGRSRCPGCRRTLRAWELIPLLSYVALRGRCSGCARGISLQYPLVELSGALAFVYALMRSEMHIVQAVLLGTALWLLVLIAVADAKTQSIPDMLNIPFIIFSVLYGWMSGGIDLLAPCIAAGFFALQWIVSRGQWIGSGDILLAAGIGALLGSWVLTVCALGLAYILGACVASVVLLRTRHASDHIAFGPFLAAAAMLVLAFGENILMIFTLHA